MSETKKYRAKRRVIFAIVLGLMLILYGGCRSRDKIFTIGIINISYFQDEIVKGFKDGMSELGYIEGKDIVYICQDKIGNNDQDINAAIKTLLANDIDLLVTTSNEAALSAKKAVDGKDIPIVAVACAAPVDIGLVESLSHPGGNITGIQVVNTMPKGLEWLVKIVPHAKKIYLPYNPDDMISNSYIGELNKTASQLGIELVFHEINSGEEVVAAIENMPKNVDAIYRIPSPTVSSKVNEINQAAAKRRLPMGSGSGLYLNEIVIAYSSDNFEMGRQAARLANQIHQGTKPADLPFETSESYLTINLKVAERLGIHISDDILMQAKTIIR